MRTSGVYLLCAFLLLSLNLLFVSCSSDETNSEEPMLIVKFNFDGNQQRLNNLGQPAAIPAGHAAQTPDFHTISAHYFELAPDMYTQLGDGSVLYHAPETTQGGTNAIDFSQAKIVSEGETFLKIPLSQVASGNYNWVRVSLSYQNYSIKFRQAGVDYNGTLASFVGFNTYITSHSIGNNFFDVNANRLQGYWAFALDDYPYSSEGQAPAGATTVPNPLASTSPIPAGSCVVTGKFANELQITGNETKDVVVTLSLSINKSFEWQEITPDGKFEPSIGENVVDMGLRGLIPSFTREN
ncbi:hypothetical protein HUK80_10545 [Flavobacterium sp. MAH-1]|uniref:Lipoprotein n=1 Tax=Flavobacterium agri TaxID=2743471 RepID=A0A7Y8Y4X9_9FLAO|nr:hypothetical protein [Flavobacterium agri]NUY81336.1 hypothetical protein [Flavobacterium agri]NYA71360.1 hypothetical protein [Flavobacterium agri]